MRDVSQKEPDLLQENQVLTTADLRKAGISGQQVRTLVKKGRLHRVERGVYTTSPPEGRLLLQALSRNRAYLVFTGTTAIQLRTQQEITLPVEALAPPEQTATSTGLLHVRRSRVLQAQRIEGLPVVTAVVAARDALRRWGTAVEQKIVVFLEQQYSRRRGQERLDRDLAAAGRSGLGRVRRLLRRASIGADSESERKLVRGLKQQGLELRQNVRIGDYHWDVVIEDAKVAIDLDSYLYHGVSEDGETEETFIRDRWKGNDAARRGYMVLHYTGECVFHHLREVVEQVRSAVEQRRKPGPVRLLSLETTPVWRWHRALRVVWGADLPEESIPPARSWTGY